MGAELHYLLNYGHDLSVEEFTTFCFLISSLQKLQLPESWLFSFASFLVSRSVSFIS